jgi:hypothetical protein
VRRAVRCVRGHHLGQVLPLLLLCTQSPSQPQVRSAHNEDQREERTHLRCACEP